MTAAQLLVRMRAKDMPSGVCIKYEWRWDLDGVPCTRAVNTLMRRGLVQVTYYSHGEASLHLVHYAFATVSS